MICMCIIDSTIFTLHYTIRIWLFYHKVLASLSFIFEHNFLLLPLLNKLVEPWVRTCGIIRRVRKIKDILIATDRKTFDFL